MQFYTATMDWLSTYISERQDIHSTTTHKACKLTNFPFIFVCNASEKLKDLTASITAVSNIHIQSPIPTHNQFTYTHTYLHRWNRMWNVCVLITPLRIVVKTVERIPTCSSFLFVGSGTSGGLNTVSKSLTSMLLKLDIEWTHLLMEDFRLPVLARTRQLPAQQTTTFAERGRNARRR
jgi:hypothetical protein